MALHGSGAATGTFTAASAVYTGAATTLDLTDATAFAGGSVRFGSSSSIIYDAANTLGIRNGTNAQTLKLYNTFTAGTPDSESLDLLFSSNIAVIRTAKNGTGTARALSFQYNDQNTALSIPTAISSAIGVGTGGSGAHTAGIMDVGNGASYTRLSSTNIVLSVTGTFSDGAATSTCIWNVVSITPTINYTAASKTGTVNCARIAPVNTSLPTGVNAGLALASTASGLTGAILYHNQVDEVTNAEYVYEKFNSNVWEIGSVKLGSGTLRGIRFGISGNSIGFLGHAVQALPTGYTLTATQVPSRTLNANASATAANNNAVISQMIQDLQGYGLLA